MSAIKGIPINTSKYEEPSNSVREQHQQNVFEQVSNTVGDVVIKVRFIGGADGRWMGQDLATITDENDQEFICLASELENIRKTVALEVGKVFVAQQPLRLSRFDDDHGISPGEIITAINPSSSGIVYAMNDNGMWSPKNDFRPLDVKFRGPARNNLTVVDYGIGPINQISQNPHLGRDGKVMFD